MEYELLFMTSPLPIIMFTPGELADSLGTKTCVSNVQEVTVVFSQVNVTGFSLSKAFTAARTLTVIKPSN